jgi:UDP-N-acetylmuramoylalanine--D-glutamate ligase
VPDIGMLGVVDGVLVDRAFVNERQTQAVELIDVQNLPVTGQHNVANALSAAALARSFGVPPAAVQAGLSDFHPKGHRLELVTEVDGVRYVDDSKATNAHAANVSLAAFHRVVWIAGGLAKGGRFDDLVQDNRHRLVAVVLMGSDRGAIREAMRRHAPKIPVIEVPESETDPMTRAVQEASRVARPSDCVLLAPACASMDQFDDYAARGEAFQAAVRRLEH